MKGVYRTAAISKSISSSRNVKGSSSSFLTREDRWKSHCCIRRPTSRPPQDNQYQPITMPRLLVLGDKGNASGAAVACASTAYAIRSVRANKTWPFCHRIILASLAALTTLTWVSSEFSEYESTPLSGLPDDELSQRRIVRKKQATRMSLINRWGKHHGPRAAAH